MANVPDDWNSFYSNCGACGGRKHASGTETCACDDIGPGDCQRCIEETDGEEGRGMPETIDGLCLEHREEEREIRAEADAVSAAEDRAYDDAALPY